MLFSSPADYTARQYSRAKNLHDVVTQDRCNSTLLQIRLSHVHDFATARRVATPFWTATTPMYIASSITLKFAHTAGNRTRTQTQYRIHPSFRIPRYSPSIPPAYYSSLSSSLHSQLSISLPAVYVSRVIRTGHSSNLALARPLADYDQRPQPGRRERLACPSPNIPLVGSTTWFRHRNLHKSVSVA